MKYEEHKQHFCSAREQCDDPDEEVFEQYDNYGIYGGRWHDGCWAKFGYSNFVFDSGYAGERLEEEW